MLQFAWFLMSGKSDNCYIITILLFNYYCPYYQTLRNIQIESYCCCLFSGYFNTSRKYTAMIILQQLSFFQTLRNMQIEALC